MAFDYYKYQLPPEVSQRSQFQFSPQKQMNRIEQERFAQNLRKNYDIEKTLQQKRLDEWQDSFNLWKSGKLSEADLYKKYEESRMNSMNETETRKWEVEKGALDETVLTTKLGTRENEIQAKYLRGELELNDAYKQYSELSRMAAVGGLLDLSAKLSLSAELFLKRMEDDIKGAPEKTDDGVIEFLNSLAMIGEEEPAREEGLPLELIQELPEVPQSLMSKPDKLESPYIEKEGKLIPRY